MLLPASSILLSIRTLRFLVLLFMMGCDVAEITGADEAQVVVSFVAPATVRSAVVEVSGPGLTIPLVWNIPILGDSIASDTLSVPVGLSRRFSISAFDSTGFKTYFGEETITVASSSFASLRFTLRPIMGSVGITVNFDGYQLSVTDTSWRRISAGDTLRVQAFALSAGQALPPSVLNWGSTNPAIFTVDGGLIRAQREGVATLVVSYGGASARILVDVRRSSTGILSDPDSLRSVLQSSVHLWINTHMGMSGGGPLLTQAQTYTASWNNFNLNFYSSLDADGTRLTRGWQNTASAAGRTSISAYWDGFSRALEGAVRAQRSFKAGATLESSAATLAASATAYLIQGAAIAGFALNFDRAIIFDEVFPEPRGFSDRKTLREAALAMFDSAIAVSSRSSFITPSSWTNGRSYSNTELVRIARTMAANLLANWPRTAAELESVDWGRVRSYAAGGLSSGSPFDFMFIGDGCVTLCPEILVWFNSLDTGRLHTRVANLLDASQRTPWPDGGNPRPNSLDRRLGDGSFGTASMIGGFGNVPKTVNAGTDFAWSSQAPFNMARGSYHQSNIGHIRYDVSGTQSPSGIYSGFGAAPLFSAAQNDLLWAEALIRGGEDLVLAAAKINNTRVNRGGLPPATAGDGTAGLLQKLLYEQEIELLGLGAASFHLRRRTAELVTGTPREMPVPYYVLERLGFPTYSWGGASPVSSPTPP